MRKLRDFIFYAFLIIPAVGIVIGVQHAMKKQSKTDKTQVSKQSGPSGHSEKGMTEKKTAKADKHHHSKIDDEGGYEAAEREVASHRHKPIVEPPVKDTGQECASVEYRGDAAQKLQVSPDDWTRVMNLFHRAKDDYLKWLEANRTSFQPEAYQFIEKRIRFARIQRPPVSEEPDLAWRGIAVWSLDQSMEPLIRVGGGFMELALKQPTRARFELARLIAQGFSTCELKRAKLEDPFQTFAKCMNINDEKGCESQSYSELGWATSTALATKTVPIGCTIPAFKEDATKVCLQTFDEGLKLHTVFHQPSSSSPSLQALNGQVHNRQSGQNVQKGEQQ